MARTTSAPKKKTAEAPKRASVRKRTASAVVSIDSANEQALLVLKQLNIEEELQNDIQWCLGSYRYDQNPIGLIETGRKALDILKNAKAKNTKGVTAKVISDLQKVLK